MTRQEAKELLPVIEAWANGEEIQAMYCDNGRWEDINDPTFSAGGWKWRIKPKCREFWVVVTRGSGEVAITLTHNPTPREFDPCLYNIWHCHGELSD